MGNNIALNRSDNVQQIVDLLVDKNTKTDKIGDIKKIDAMNKIDIINYIRGKAFTKLITDDKTFTDKMKAIEMYNTKLIPMSLELFHNFETFCEEYIPPLKTNYKKYIKLEFTKDTLKTHVDESANFKEFDASKVEYLNYRINNINFTKEFAKSDISLDEFNNSFSEISEKKDMLGISKKMLSLLPTYHKTRLLNAFNECYSNPDALDLVNEFSFGAATFSYKEAKNGPKEKVDSYRKIIAIPNTVSHFHRILALRLCDHLRANGILDDNIQKGCIPGIKCPLLQQIIKVKSVVNDSIKNNKKTAIMYLDIADAFGSVNRDSLFYILRLYKVPENFISYVDNYYKGFSYYVRNKEIDVDNITWKDGLVQGCPLSPILFITIINYVLSYMDDKYKSTVGYAFSDTNKMLFSAYVDDICVVVNDKDKLASVYNELVSIFKSIGFLINPSKSGITLINYTPEEISSFNLDGIPIVTKYTYLGATITSVSQNSVITEFNKLLYGRLSYLDVKVADNKEKIDKMQKFIVPWVTRQMANLFDLSAVEKNNVLNIIISFQKKWGDNSHLDIFPNLEDIVKGTSDMVLSKLTFDVLNVATGDDGSVASTEFSNYTNKKFSYTYDDIDADVVIDTKLAPTVATTV
jgi:hypothetical protein